MGLKRTNADVVIIGGGASGLAAAAELGMICPGLNVVIIEKNKEPGRKLRATGSGRCNISNTEAEGYEEIRDFFSKIGIALRIYENGLVYPYSESAHDVACILADRALRGGASLLTCSEAAWIERTEDARRQRFTVSCRTTEEGGRSYIREIGASCIILAAGGKSGPMFGTTGDGYRLASGLGHTIVTPVPALTPVDCSEWNKGNEPCAVSLAGTRTRGRVTLCKNGECLASETGEIQFTKTGLSGICVFNLTRFMRYNRNAGENIGDFVICADLYPDGDIRDHLRGRASGPFSGEPASDILRTVLKENIASYVMRSAAAGGTADGLIKKPARDLTEPDIEAINRSVHRLEFHPSGLRGWKDAQVTSGGVNNDEINAETSESLLVPGLYITGELADRDYPCGGFNLSNAWLTALHAAGDIARLRTQR